MNISLRSYVANTGTVIFIIFLLMVILHNSLKKTGSIFLYTGGDKIQYGRHRPP